MPTMMTGRKPHFYNNEDDVITFDAQNKEAYDFKEVEEKREMEFFQNEL
jgi:hypothetical protein